MSEHPHALPAESLAEDSAQSKCTTPSTQSPYSIHRVVIRSLLKETSARKVAGRPTSPNQTTLSSKERGKVSELPSQIEVLGELGIDQSLEFSPSGAIQRNRAGPTNRIRTIPLWRGCRGRNSIAIPSRLSIFISHPMTAEKGTNKANRN